MDRPNSHRLSVSDANLSVDDAKEKLRARSQPLAGPTPGAGLGAAGAVLAETRRRPWRAAGIALALGVVVGASSTARRTLFAGIRRVVARGG